MSCAIALMLKLHTLNSIPVNSVVFCLSNFGGIFLQSYHVIKLSLLGGWLLSNTFYIMLFEAIMD